MFGRYALPHRWSFAAGAVCLLATNWLTVNIPIVLGEGIDALTDGGEVAGSAWLIAGMGLAVVVVRTLSRVLFFNPGRDMEYRLRKDLFGHLLALQPSFYALNRTGDIVSRASSDISWTRAMIGFGLMQLVNTSVAIVMTGWKMIGISSALTLWTLVPVIASLAAVQLFLRQLFHLQKRSQEQLGDISDHVLGSFLGVATVQGFVAEVAFSKRLEDLNNAWLGTTMRLALIRSLAFPLLSLAGGAAIFLLLFVGGPMAVAGELTVGELAAFATLIGTLLPPLKSLGWMLSVLQRGKAALERIFELLDAVVDRPEGDQPVVQAAGSGPAIEVRDLEFAYPDDLERPILTGVNLSVAAGSVVGVFGRTGAGKSTLLRLLARLYDPKAGTIYVDGDDITSLERSVWRTRLAVAPQRPFLFSETIADNIGLGGSPDAGTIERAVEEAALKPDIEVMPKGLETVVGQRGIMLSGGQRQRVALARALIRDADLVLLDDVLSAVDHGTESTLIESLQAAGEHRDVPPTIFIVSHRISALRNADSIVVLQDGQVIDQGTHAQLIERSGVYQDVWEVQKS
jgi:ATP-binding cassette subfamily B protein